MCNDQCMSQIGERIKALRKARHPKMSQTQLGDAVGLDQSTISDIEKGAGFGADVLMKICVALGTSPNFIMLGGSESEMEEAQLVGFYRSCSPENRANLMGGAKWLAEMSKSSTANPFPLAPALPAPKKPRLAKPKQ